MWAVVFTLGTYAQLQDNCGLNTVPPSIHNANVAQDSKPWADDRAPNATLHVWCLFGIKATHKGSTLTQGPGGPACCHVHIVDAMVLETSPWRRVLSWNAVSRVGVAGQATERAFISLSLLVEQL